ncbi:hypothetical protein FHR83_007275 [Actinoplanes campanulatus]|uniref:Secreted protein n=1 Tax=Actinoplanes campanulatus TaxID=113559 RepID=A0A7W5ANM9_9ACTN|nr:DUF6493 family protein [Actinoplanes campanulatus]MBB3099568.1 hypothetical protein [Actinoplanes campanulatus]GGN42198.1 hypothetical protein GCM10010109_73110 [Actinoplanes campanulatus]GID39918.1 hypothetical protein Aca09nite_64240 [Actinoplanes campanulatus]
MPLTWAGLARPFSHTDSAALTALLLGATERERLAFAAEIERRIRADDEGPWARSTSPAGLFGLTVIACMPTAARAAALLTRRSMRDWGRIRVDLFLEIARARELPWIGDLGVRLCGRLPARNPAPLDWEFAEALLIEGGAEPPVTEPVVRGWLAAVRFAPLAGYFRASPWLDLLLPSAFEIDGLSGLETDFPYAVAQLTAEGRLDRATILAATADRLTRPGTAAALRPFARLHDALSPVPAETAPHLPVHARLLPEAPSPVAAMARGVLQALDDDGRLPLETLLEISAATLARPEKTLVRAQIDWLDRVARREPDRAGEILETVAVALAHPSLDLQERSLEVIAVHLGTAGPETVTRLAEAAGGLTGTVRAVAGALLGPVLAEPAGVVATPPAGPRAVPMPPPIGSAAELAEELTALAHAATAVRWERIMASLVTLHRTGELSGLPDEVGRLLPPELPRFNVPADVLTWRLAELSARLTGSPVPVLLATPTDVSGSIGAGTLVERMERLEEAGRDPWPVDFEQALLRVAHTGDATVLARAAALGSPEGERLAGWLGRERVETIGARLEQPAGHYGYDAWTPIDTGPELIRRVVVTMAPRRDDPRLPLLGRLLFTIGRRPTAREDYLSFHHCPPDVLAMTLPHDREAVAAWALPEIAALADRDSRDDTALPLLGDCSGPPGPAVALALAYGLGARHQPGRAAAVDTYLAVTAETGPLPAVVGAELGDLCADGTVKLTRVVPALADAHAAGASAAVWETVTGALPPLLKATPRGLPDLLELATRVASELGRRGEVPGLDAVAGRGGGARLTREAKRLQATLAGPLG